MPKLAAGGVAVGGLEGGERDAAKFCEGCDATFAEVGGFDSADAVEYFDRERGEEGGLSAASDDAEATGAFEARSDSRDDFGLAGADADGEAGEFEDFELETPKGTGEVVLKEWRAEEIEIEAVVGVWIDGAGEVFEH